MTQKATKILGILKRTFIFWDKKTFLLLYKSMIKAHISQHFFIIALKYHEILVIIISSSIYSVIKIIQLALFFLYMYITGIMIIKQKNATPF